MMLNNEMISIIMPSYNREKTIERAIESVLQQTYTNWELIIVDDASDDDTKTIVNHYITDQRIKYLRNEKNMGANFSRNRGIRSAQGKYVAFLDSDNTWEKNKLEKQINVLRNECDMVYCAVNSYLGAEVRRIPNIVFPLDYYDIHLNKVLVHYNVVDTSAMMIKRDFLIKIGLFDEKMPRHQDYELAIRIVENGTVRYINETLVNTYRMENSISNNSDALFEAIVLMLKKHSQFFASDNGIYNHLLMGLKYCLEKQLGFAITLSYLKYVRSELCDIFQEQIWKLWEYAFESIIPNYDENSELLRQYAKNVYKRIQDRTPFAIYGAGVRATRIYDKLTEKGKSNLKYFVVSNKDGNKEYLHDKKVVSVKEMFEQENRDILIILAMKSEYVNQVKIVLNDRGFNNYFVLENY